MVIRFHLIPILLALVCFSSIRHGEGAVVGKLKKTQKVTASELASFQWPTDRPVDTDYVVNPYESGGSGGDAFLKWSG